MKNYDVVIMGGGPAGLSCAIEAAEAGAEVALIDENRRAGGQLFKQIHKFFGSREHRAGVRGYEIGLQLLEQAGKLGVNTLLNSVSFGLFGEKTVGIVKGDRIEMIQGKKLLLATGAIENAIAFPGWTLPGVMGAGAAQTMINVERVLPGQKFVILGAGNVGLIVAYQLLQAGAEVLAVLEAAPKIGGYQVHASKIRRAGVLIIVSTTIKEARGEEYVSEVVTTQLDNSWKSIPGTEQVLPADSVCIATGLHPSTDLAQMAGCVLEYVPELGGFLPVHDDNMETTIEGIYVAGDAAGIEEASTAMEEGRLAGVDMSQKLGYLSEEKASARKRDVEASMASLRHGPFGQMRRLARARIIQRCRDFVQSKAKA